MGSSFKIDYEFPRNVINILPSQVRSLMKDITILDIREEWEYEKYHIPGSLLLPMEFFEELFPKMFGKASAIIICEHGNRTIRLALSRHYLFEKVYNVIGGINLWINSGYEVISGMDENGKIWRRWFKY
ncbi:rhodanese [Candidatus Acidianus copahuensis]|uniref:Rhodanese n=1 Tax=Candidatus Acidianus copahuensis TaxID=1160895 RepID=A0A031LLY3_9CREN|nr:rhodanese-like domain-containing protein [Candidatus Acidianus copahuensis]EZQ02241.1 rhodanese [Candidatus Acidianus copahuensis]